MSDTESPGFGIYVYGITRDLPGEALKDVKGVSGAPVLLMEQDGLIALGSRVSLSEFGEAALRENLEDIEWLESTARAHHAVVDAALERAATVPLGLVTVYRNEERVRKALRERREEFVGALDRITGRTEWGVKVYADVKRPESASAPAGKEAPSRPGTSYLQRRLVQRNTAEEERRKVLAVAEYIHCQLCDLAVATRLHRPQDPQLSGEQGWMLLNAAYLVDDARVEEFHDAVAHLTRLHPDVRVRLTGPWAPYSFAAEEEPEEEEAWTGP
ncbi:GvpL/GvpF family gas vesicle protein [Actinocorallia sp. B10E7]|uniref:GvpL/GvpF family gas vesicle protein n=1 Tax=Actinocorallia sp. B10E7 TaxID=3153558 RepID=UPI00325D5A2A